MAPTKPLVLQQIEACHKVVGIDLSDTAHLEGSVAADQRFRLWREKRIFFCTPQTFDNDIKSHEIDDIFDNIVCVIIDEAHKAQGNYAYASTVSSLH